MDGGVDGGEKKGEIVIMVVVVVGERRKCFKI